MLQTRDQFTRNLTDRRLRLALIGMSNSGKSTTSSRLRQSGFSAFEVDEAINRSLGIDSMLEAAEWMGFPYDSKYSQRKQQYLELEERLTRTEIPPDSNFVLDTTGSVIHGSDLLKAWISENFLVVGLRVDQSLIEQMIKDYFQSPKTVVWGDEFQPEPGEEPRQALCRCYPTLLANRALAYESLADVMIEAKLARADSSTAANLLDSIQSQLPTSLSVDE